MKLPNDTYTYEADFLCMNKHTAHTSSSAPKSQTVHRYIMPYHS